MAFLNKPAGLFLTPCKNALLTLTLTISIEQLSKLFSYVLRWFNLNTSLSPNKV